jgi:hypothetical protein
VYKREEFERRVDVEKQHVVVNAILLNPNPRFKIRNKKHPLPYLKIDSQNVKKQVIGNMKSVTLPTVDIEKQAQKETLNVEASYKENRKTHLYK